MLEHAEGNVSDAFVELQRVQRSFDDVSSLGRLQMSALKQLANKLGRPCIRLCVRELGRIGLEGERSRWASQLLTDLARRAEHRTHVVAALLRAAENSTHGSVARLRALGLLSQLGEELPPGMSQLQVAHAMRESMGDISSMLTSADSIAVAGDMLVNRLPAHEMLAFVRALCADEPGRALPLLSELLLRNDMEAAARRELKHLWASARASIEVDPGTNRREPGLAESARQAVATATVGRHATGRRAVLAWRIRTRARTPSYRALRLLLDGSGAVTDGTYWDDLSVADVDRELLGPLREQGYQLDTMRRADAAHIVIRAAQAARNLGRALPRGFYLGRDLLGIYDQHSAGLRPEDELSAVFDQANALLAAGEPERARPLYEHLVARAPDNPDARSALAMCLIALDDERGALTHLHRAAWLEPHNPNHHWNLASIAHRQGRSGGCYLALIDYIDHSDENLDDAPGDTRERRTLATRYIDEYERIAGLEYPGADPEAVADVDEILLRAWRCVRADEFEQAAQALEHALERVPNHYRALTCLGIACSRGQRLSDARAHLYRALELRPGFPLAERALARVLSPKTSVPHRHETVDLE